MIKWRRIRQISYVFSGIALIVASGLVYWDWVIYDGGTLSRGLVAGLIYSIALHFGSNLIEKGLSKNAVI